MPAVVEARIVELRRAHPSWGPRTILHRLAGDGVEPLPGRSSVHRAFLRHGLIDPLTQWGLRTTLRQWLKWCDEGRDTQIAFNISALSLQHLDFPDLVERMCRALEVPTDRLVLELTEGATQPLVKLMDTLTRFRIKGIGLALDDFGTGFSSMMQLRQLPFTEVKIDRFFVRDMTSSNDSLLIVKSTIDLAHGLGMTATAEGIETEEQARLLRELGCDVGQGYWIAQPLEPDALDGWEQEFSSRWDMLVQEPRKCAG
jgi:EAL domain-containing protein (putative c-di-GMP-specific phosphodiesterase class I)